MFGLFRRRCVQKPNLPSAGKVLREFFAPLPFEALNVSERTFPSRIRPDLQRSLESLFAPPRTRHFSGLVRTGYGEETGLSEIMVSDEKVAIAPPSYEEIDIGEETPVRCLKTALWLGQEGPVKFAVVLHRTDRSFGEKTFHLQITATGQAPLAAEASALVTRYFAEVEKGIRNSQCYRGKVLSLEMESRYSGQPSEIRVHKLRQVTRDQVILDAATLDLLDRNILQFVGKRQALGEFGQSRKKGLLFYGPPGTGKTHTLHYLASALPGHTTLLISAEQVYALSEYMTLARLLQPAMLVIEDADLIARDREHAMNACAEPMLNKLLNEMDGLREDADILFILSTNRPETLEPALTARPGRIDQAIEFPLPDAQGREKLVALYARGVAMEQTLVKEIVDRTEGVSGAFIKELMRRAVQFHLERGSSEKRIDGPDVYEALEEMLFKGGRLNMQLLGAARHKGRIGFVTEEVNGDG